MSREDLQHFIELALSDESLGSQLQADERTQRIEQLRSVAAEHSLDLTPAEAEDFLGAVEQSKLVQGFLKDFGHRVDFRQFSKLAKDLYP